MSKENKVRKVIVMSVIICALVLVGILGSYAFFISNGTNNPENISTNTGTLALIFADGNAGITESLEFGSSIEKTFTIENTGTLEGFAKINFEDLVNTYTEGSLTYTLSYSETEEGTYTEIVTNENVPRSESSSTQVLADSLVIPAGTKYFYKLIITLNYLDDVDQTTDLEAIFSTHFKLEQGLAKYLITFNDGINTDITKEVIENAAYGDLPVPTKNGFAFAGWYTEPNGLGTKITSDTIVNIRTNQTLYAFWKEISTQTLISKANDSSVTDYNNSSNKGEMFTFTHPTTSQTPGLTDYRYIGNVPNNYIKFNDETWRIIGVFKVQNENSEWEDRIKIVRNESIGNLMWNETLDKNNNGINEWNGATLQNLLNLGNYYSQTGNYSNIGLKEKAKKQISKVKFYLGGFPTASQSASEYYSLERGNSTYNTYRSKYIFQEVGLIYPSDYLYTFSLGIYSNCYEDGWTCDTGYANRSWLFKAKNEWTTTPASTAKDCAAYIKNTGIVCGDNYDYVVYEYSVRPTVYLNSSIEIAEGNGSSSTPYLLKEE